VEQTHVAFGITITKCCVWNLCLIVTFVST